jgi:adenylate cyclase
MQRPTLFRARLWFILVALLAGARCVRAQHYVNVDSLEQALASERDPVKRLDIITAIGRGAEDLAVGAEYAAFTIRMADSLLAHGHAGDNHILSQKGTGIWNLGATVPDMYADRDSMLARYRRAIALWESIGDETKESFGKGALANFLIDEGKLSEALPMVQGALKVHERQKDTFNLASDYRNLGIIHVHLGDYAGAVDHYLTCVALAHTQPDNYSRWYEALALNGIGRIYEDLGQGDTAISYYRRSVTAGALSWQPASGLVSMLNLGGILLADGDTATYENLLDSARALADLQKRPDDVALVYSAVSDRFRLDGDLDSAQFYGRRALEYGERSGIVERKVYGGMALARALLALHKPNEALEVMLDQVRKQDTIKFSLRDRRELMLALAEVHEGAGHAVEALASYKQYHALADSVSSETARRKLRFLDLRRQSATDSLKAREERRVLVVESEKRIAEEQSTKRLYLFSGIGVLFLAGGLWSRLRFTRRAKRAIEKERDRSDGLLLNILPSEVAEELKMKGSAAARLMDEVTVLFTDFKGFTAMSEQLSPERLVHDLNECFSAFDRICEERGIEKIKTIGDAYMAAGGLPTPNGTHAMDVIDAALEMRELIATNKSRKVAAGEPCFEIRIGVHSGPVVAGIVGVKKFQYDIWGDTVNTASRMESSGEVGRVNISEATYALVKNEPGLTFTARGKVQAKGKGEMKMYFVEPT